MAEQPDDVDQRAWQAALDWLFALERRPGDAAVAAALQAWLSESDMHRRAYEQARSIWDLAPHAQPAFPQQWQAESRPVPPQAAAARQAFDIHRRPVGRRWLLAGAGGLTAGLALLAVNGRWPTSDYRTRVGETRTVVLNDGTQIRLNTDTALRMDDGPARRAAELIQGEAFFDVAPDRQRPFTVAAGPGRIDVLGTQFNVRREGPRLSVVVAEGHVAVGWGDRDVTLGKPLRRGDRLRLDLATGLTERDSVSPATAAAWRNGQLIVERRTVADVLDEIGRYHSGIILLRDAQLGATAINGVYDIAHPVEAVRAVAAGAGGRMTALGPYVLIVSRR
jgi:transmembrane sensor